MVGSVGRATSGRARRVLSGELEVAPLQLLHSSWCSQLWRWQHRVASEPDTSCLLRKGRSGTQGLLDITSNPVLSTLYMRTGFANSETCATSRRSCDTLDC